MNINTVYIIGAGASSEVGLPLGSELKTDVSRRLDIQFNSSKGCTNGDLLIVDALRLIAGENNNSNDIHGYIKDAKKISRAMPLAISIDNFVDSHRDNKNIALLSKLAIARSILDSETNSRLYFTQSRGDSSINFEEIQDSWFIPFFQTITEGCDAAQLVDRFSSIVLIVYNYDRCIEHFLYRALLQYYPVSEHDAETILANLKIVHPYGLVGKYPFSNIQGGFNYGYNIDEFDLVKISQGLKTFSEGVDPNESEILETRKSISNSERIVFIGFAFHELNMEFLDPGLDDYMNNTFFECYATAYNVSDADQSKIKNNINNTLGNNNNTNISNEKCYDFFNSFRRSLSY